MPSPIPSKGNIIVDSVNQEAMVRKLEKQFQEKESSHLKGLEAQNLEQAKAKTTEAMKRRESERRDPSYQTLKPGQTTVITEPQHKEAQLVKDQILNQQTAPIPPSLKGRVTVSEQR